MSDIERRVRLRNRVNNGAELVDMLIEEFSNKYTLIKREEFENVLRKVYSHGVREGIRQALERADLPEEEK